MRHLPELPTSPGLSQLLTAHRIRHSKREIQAHAFGPIADAGDLAPGARIEAWHGGAELRSLPPQYPATRIRVLAGP